MIHEYAHFSWIYMENGPLQYVLNDHSQAADVAANWGLQLHFNSWEASNKFLSTKLLVLHAQQICRPDSWGHMSVHGKK